MRHTAKLRGVVWDRSTLTVRVIRLRAMSVPQGTLLREGLIFGKRQWLVRGGHGYRREYLIRRAATWYPLSPGHPEPLTVKDDAMESARYSDATLDGAVESRIADRVLHGGLRWEIIALIILGVIAFVAVIT